MHVWPNENVIACVFVQLEERKWNENKIQMELRKIENRNVVLHLL